MDDPVPIQDMADGDLGVVAYWDNVNVPIGTVVQRYNSVIVILGQRSGLCYDLILRCRPEVSPKVHILPSGSHIRVVTPTPASMIHGSWHNLVNRDAWQGNYLRSSPYRIDTPITIEPQPPRPDSNS